MITFYITVSITIDYKSLQSRYEKVGRTGINRTTKEQRQPIDKAYYICQTYNRLGKDTCTSHKIEARDLYNVVIEDIRQHDDRVLNDGEGFYTKLARKLEKQHMADEGTLKKELYQTEVLFRNTND